MTKGTPDSLILKRDAAKRAMFDVIMFGKDGMPKTKLFVAIQFGETPEGAVYRANLLRDARALRDDFAVFGSMTVALDGSRIPPAHFILDSGGRRISVERIPVERVKRADAILAKLTGSGRPPKSKAGLTKKRVRGPRDM